MEKNTVNSAEKQLQEARWQRDALRLRLAFEAGHITSVEWDIKRDEVRRFISATSALPLTPEDKPITFHDVCQNIYHEDRDSFIANVQAALKHPQGHYRNEFRVLDPETGEPLWLSATGCVEFDSDGLPAYLIGFSRDITAQKKAELELRESQSRYAGIIESAMDAIISVDGYQHIELFNAAAEKMFGYPTSEMLGKPIECLLPERFRQGHRDYIEHFTHAGVANRKMGDLGMVVGLRANGEEFPVEASISKIGNNGDKAFTAILRDVSERKRTECKLVENEALLRLFIEYAPASIAMFDRNMCYLAVSNRWKEDFRLPLEQPLVGHSHYEVFPEIPERWREIHQRGLKGERLLADEDFFVREDGSTQWIKWEIIPWELSDGRIGGILVATEEITERMLAKMALREANLRKDEFLAMLAHELRNPLAPISNAVQILNRTQAANPVVVKTSEMIGRQVKHLVHLVDDLLDVSRVSRGKIKLQKAPVDLVEIIHQAIETTQPLIELRNHQLRVSLPKKPVRVDGDAIRLTQVVSNLLNNAAKYTDEDGIISLSLDKQTVTEPETGYNAIIRVKDNGRGMEPAALKNLFDIFYQVDRNLDRSEGGLGIGLYLVRSLLAMHGGQVTASSEGRGRGSEFVIRLPCLPETPLDNRTDNNDTGKTIRGRRILLVEDNADVADSMISLLELLGHEVVCAANGRDAITTALHEQPEVILLDIGLPLVNGYDACRAIRHAGLTSTMIVALTGYGLEEERQKVEDAGFNCYMAKPVDIDVLESLLDQR